MLENTLSKKSMIIAIRTGLSALDEHSTATKAWTEAKIYNAHKPSKFAVHFYAVTELINLYFSLFFAIIQEIKHVYVVLLTQMAHQTKSHPDPSGCQFFFIDNFYTWHHLAHAL